MTEANRILTFSGEQLGLD